MKTFKPNTVLPDGARLIHPAIEKVVGGWVSMKFDAEFVDHGVRWLRAFGGFGDRNDREDWVADLPAGTLHFGGWDWAGPGPDFRKQLRAKAKECLIDRLSDSRRLQKKVKALKTTIQMLKRYTT